MVPSSFSTKTHPRTVTAIDASDLALVLDGGGHWFAARMGSADLYVVRTGGARELPHVRLHRQLLGVSGRGIVDHENGDTLDNRRKNLRAATIAENIRNGRKRAGTSQFKGVHFDARRGRWVAHIMFNRRSIYLGTFSDEADGARAYDAAARKYHGEFARTNFREAA